VLFWLDKNGIGSVTRSPQPCITRCFPSWQDCLPPLISRGSLFRRHPGCFFGLRRNDVEIFIPYDCCRSPHFSLASSPANPSSRLISGAKRRTLNSRNDSRAGSLYVQLSTKVVPLADVAWLCACVESGGIEYSALSHPLETPCSFTHRGTFC